MKNTNRYITVFLSLAIDGIDYAIVHDNHYTTAYDVVIAFSEVDFVAGVSLLDWES